MNLGIENLVANIGMSFENTIFLVVMVAGLIFYAKDYKLGLVMHFLFSGLLFMWFYEAGYNYVFPVVTFFMFLIALSFTLYSIAKTTKSPGGGFI